MRALRSGHSVLVVALAALLHAPVALAGPTDPVVWTQANDALGPTQSPGTRRPEPLGYVEREYLVSGKAQDFNYEQTPRPGVVVPIFPPTPYTTRIITRVPADLSKFNGTVVIEWFNSTVGFDTAPVWDISAEYFTRTGTIYVGVTNSRTSTMFMNQGCVPPIPGLPPTCGTRYATVDLPENGMAFEVLSQIATLVRSTSHDNPLPVGGLVQRVFHAGQSQQGGSVITYANNFHFPANDGYFIQAASGARQINFNPPCGAPDAPAYPICAVRLQGSQALLRRDLPVPVMQTITETDVASPFGMPGRQINSRTFRYYELTGVAHTPVHKNLRFFDLPFDIASFCGTEINSSADGPVFGAFLINAAWANLEQWVRTGAQPPASPVIQLQADGTIARDEFGNALGGLRLPTLDVPVATYGPSNQPAAGLPDVLTGQANLFCRLSGTVTPFDADRLAQLYPTQQSFETPFRQRVADLQSRGFLLPEDAQRLLVAAGLEPAPQP